MNGLEQWRMRWERAGMATIPLYPNSKQPVFEAWNVLPPVSQWHAANEKAGGAWRGNIGILPGPDRVVLDADTSETAANVERFLAGLGIHAPIEQTPSGGTHAFIAVAGMSPGFNFVLLSPAFGKGELRTRKANVAVTCSAIGDRRYRFIHGSPEALADLRPVQWRDLAAVVGAVTSAAGGDLDAPPVRLVRRDMPERAGFLFALLRSARKGAALAGYPSRSEAEAAVIAMLLLAGWDYAAIEGAFEQWRPGHYREYSARSRPRYLEQTYRNVLTALASTRERLQIAEHYRVASVAAWPGRGGMFDRAAYLALLAVCWQFGTWEVHAAERDLAEHAAASRRGIHGALGRLESAGRVARVHLPTVRTGQTIYPDTAARWRVYPFGLNGAVPSDSHCDIWARNGHSELWAQSEFGKTAAQVYAVLGEQPLKVKELLTLTGRGHDAVYRALGKLAAHGLADKHAAGWTVGRTPAGEVAEKLNADTAALQRRERHKSEREQWRERCAAPNKNRKVRQDAELFTVSEAV